MEASRFRYRSWSTRTGTPPDRTTGNRPTSRTNWLAAGLITALLLAASAGCSDDGDDVQARSSDDVKASAQTLGEQVASQIGSRLENPFTDVLPCTGKSGEDGGDEIVYASAMWQIPLPPEAHAGAAEKLRAAWKSTSWTITEDRTFDDGFELAATTPDNYSVRVESAHPPEAVALFVSSRCYTPTVSDAQ